MEMTRRGFLKGMAGILAAGVAPAFVGSKILMPVRDLWTPTTGWIYQTPSGSAWIKVMSIDLAGRHIDLPEPIIVAEGQEIILRENAFGDYAIRLTYKVGA